MNSKDSQGARTSLTDWLDSLEEIERKATKGPWEKGVAGRAWEIEGDWYTAATGPWYRLGADVNDRNDAELIATLRNNARALIEICRAQAKMIERPVERGSDGIWKQQENLRAVYEKHGLEV